MSKKSAMSKGYRKSEKKKPFLTKKEIFILIGIVALIALAIILFNLFYDDGYLGAEEVQANDIVYYASKNVRNRYKKIGEVQDMEGFTRATDSVEGSAMRSYTFTPDQEMGALDSVSVSGSFVKAETLAQTSITYMESSVDEITPVHTLSLNGHDAYLFGYNYGYYEAPADGEAAEPQADAEVSVALEATVEATAEPEATAAAEDAEAEQEPNVFCQNLSVYVDCGDDYTLVLHIYLKGEDTGFYMPEDEIDAYVQQFAGAFTTDFAPEAK